MLEDDNDRIALIDMDGTIADYDGALEAQMRKLQAPGEPDFQSGDHGNLPSYIRARQNLIKKFPGFWRNLPELKLGFDIVNVLRQIGFNLHILTKGPTTTTSAWTEKVEWCQDHIPDANITITQDKSLVYGRVLVDDYPPYFEGWLKSRPRGLVVCVAHPWNANIVHPNVIRYNGDNLDIVAERLYQAWNRKSGRL